MMDACELGRALTQASVIDKMDILVEIGLLCLKDAEAHGVQKAGLLINDVYDAEKSYPSSFSEAERYKSIKMGKKVSEGKDEKIAVRKTKLRKRQYYTHNGDKIHAEAFRMERYKVN